MRLPKSTASGRWLAVLALATLAITTPSLRAQTATASSALFTVDTREGDLIVTGRVIEQDLKLPLSGANVELGRRSVVTGVDGSFTLKVTLNTDGTLLEVSKPGFTSQTWTFSVGSNQSVASVGDIALHPDTGQPVVEWIKSDTTGIFISGFGLEPTLRARINWKTNTPGQVRFEVNGRTLATRSGAGPEYSAPCSVDRDLLASFSPIANSLKVTALSENGQTSKPSTLNLAVVPVPSGLRAAVNSGLYRVFGPDHVGFDFELNADKQSVTLPLVGKFGFEWGANASFDYTISDGSWETSLGLGAEGAKSKRSRRPGFTGLKRPPKAKLFLGNKEVTANLDGKAAGTATPSQGIVISEFGLNASLSSRFELGRYGLADLFGPGLSTAFSSVPGVGKILQNASLGVRAMPSLSGSATSRASPFGFKEATMTGTLGIEGAWEPEIGGVLKGRFYTGSDSATTFGHPSPVFRNVNFRVYGGYEMQAWTLKSAKEVVWVDYTYGSGARRIASGALQDMGTGYLVGAVGNADTAWQPLDRTWREAGGEQFVLAPSKSARQLNSPSPLQTFVAMGTAPSPGAVFVPSKSRRVVSSPALPAQAELPLLANVFPQSEPALASSHDDLMLLYVRDTGATNPMQFTELGWSFFDGTSWSPPAPVRAAISVIAEGFNDTGVPAGWAVDQPGNLALSFVAESTFPSGFSPAEGIGMIRVNNYEVSSGDVRLSKTVPFSTAGVTSATLKFDWTVDNGFAESNDRVSVEWSSDGVNWSSFGSASRYSAEGNAWTTKAFSLPVAAMGQPQIYLSFLFTSEYGNDCHMDNLRLELTSASSDGSGEFEPTVAFDGNGSAIAVWARIKDKTFSGTGLEQFAAQMEIVSARWDPATKIWTNPQALTDNTILDHKPQLSGPLSDGDLLLTWRQNPSNLLLGSGAPGTPTNTRIMTRRWDAAAATWGAEQVLVANLADELSDSLAARGNKAVFALTRDMDGNLDNFSDAELFYRTFDAGTGTWGALTRHTTDAIHDRNARVALDASGNIYCVWQRGDDLVMDKNFSGNPSQVRSDSGTIGFSDFTLTVGPGDNVVAVWQEMDEFGSDAHYRVFDPASGTWGLDALLSQDSDLERSFAPVWDPMGNLVLAYNNVAITKQTKTVFLDGGGTVDVPGVPQPGKVDLLLAKRALVKDLALVADSFTAEGTTFLPGDIVTLRAKVKNSGNLAEQNVQVAFYDGDPDAGGTLIQTSIVPGWLKAMDEAEVSAAWTVPMPAVARTIHAKVDPNNAVTELTETNNVQSLNLNGVDLDLRYFDGSVLRDGSVRIVVRIKNLGAPESPVTTVGLKPQGASNSLAEVSVGQLAPGESVELPVELPAGSHPEGMRSYRLILDEAASSGDIDAENNEVGISLNLWIDDDGDGLPRWWEQAHGMSDSVATDASLDADRDGFNAKAEYLAGTDPRDARSFLRPGQFNVVTGPDGATTVLSWASVADRLYRVQRSYDLKQWETAFDDISATPPLNTVEEILSPRPMRVFYRILFSCTNHLY